MMDDTARIGETENMVRDMNRCWTTGGMKNSSGSIFILMLLLMCRQPPGRLEGRDAYVAGWRGYAQAVVIHEWKETDRKVQLYTGGKSAVVTYFFSITVARGTEKQTIQGRDMVFLAKEGRRWLDAADQFLPELPQTASAGS